MKQQEVFKKIGAIIQELSEQYEYLRAEDNHLNDLELELFVANASFLTDHIEIFRKMNLQGSQRLLESGDHKSEPRFFEPVVQQVTYDIIPEEEKSGTHDAVVEEPTPEHAEEPVKDEPHAEVVPAEPEPAKEEPVFDPDHENHTEPAAEEKTPEPSFEPAPSAEVKHEPASEVFSINDKHSEQAAPATEPPLSDLKQGITLNDKLLFVKDLFNGYNLAYSEAIEILNRYSNFEDAAKFLKTNYVTKNHWDNKPATTEKFYALLKRRYA